MDKKIETSRLVGLGLVGFFVFTRNAHAYLDPGTGSMILQVAVGAIVGSLMFLKMGFRRIRSQIRQLLGRSE